jgi:hypothetical protein
MKKLFVILLLVVIVATFSALNSKDPDVPVFSAYEYKPLEVASMVCVLASEDFQKLVINTGRDYPEADRQTFVNACSSVLLEHVRNNPWPSPIGSPSPALSVAWEIAQKVGDAGVGPRTPEGENDLLDIIMSKMKMGREALEATGRITPYPTLIPSP